MVTIPDILILSVWEKETSYFSECLVLIGFAFFLNDLNLSFFRQSFAKFRGESCLLCSNVCKFNYTNYSSHDLYLFQSRTFVKHFFLFFKVILLGAERELPHTIEDCSKIGRQYDFHN